MTTYRLQPKMNEPVAALNQLPSKPHWLDEFSKLGTIDAQTRIVLERQAELDKERMKRDQ